MNYLYGLPISRRLGEARDAIRSPAGRTPDQIAEDLMILDWHGDDADQLRANDFRRDHGLPDQISMTPEPGPVIAAPIWSAEGPFSAADRFPRLRPPAPAPWPAVRVLGWLWRLAVYYGFFRNGGVAPSGKSGLRRGEVAAILKSETEGNE